MNHVNGLHLWLVETDPALAWNDRLLITTYRKDAGVAAHKAKQFIRRQKKQNWLAVDILSVKYEGTLDA